MSDELLAENKRLRVQLRELLDQARINQQIMHRQQMLDLQLIGAASLAELFDTLFRILPQASELSVATLALFDPDHEIRRILVDLDLDPRQFPDLIFLHDAAASGALQAALRKPVLGRYSEPLHGALFPASRTAPASVAIVPLLRDGRLIGSMNVGSADPARFAPHMATDFLERRGSVVAICIENVINRERLKHLGLTDSLTRVNNRRYIERRLLEEVGRCLRSGSALSCLYIDIDRFKQINDELGHQAGDEALRGVAARIKAELRLNDALGRFGGEEFLALLHDADERDAAAVAERIRAGIAGRPLDVGGGKSLHASVSIGIAVLDGARDGPAETVAAELIARADRALYRAKSAGRNRIVMQES